ncbi:MAG: hypothetical protein ACK5NK_02205 [Niabella sp.]
MHKIALSLFFIILFQVIYAQKSTIYSNVNRSAHGSGDMTGIAFDIGYKEKLREKINWYGEIGASSHDVSFYESYIDNNSDLIDASLRFVTSGMQLSGGFSCNPIQIPNDLNLQIGVVLRYQTSSLPSSVATYYPIVTNLPFPAHAFEQYEPMRTFAVGGKIAVGYSYTFKNNFFAGINGTYQTDTNGDSIYGYGLTIGKRF